MIFKPDNDYWWLYLDSDRMYWTRCSAGERVCPDMRSCEEPADIEVPDAANVVVCVPGDRIRIHRVAIPARNRRQYMAALPYALEETLLHEPEAYHLVPLGSPDRDGSSFVAVTEHEQMQAWLQRLDGRNWNVLTMLPDYLAIEDPGNNRWFLDITASPVLLRMKGRGAALGADLCSAQPPSALLLALEQACQMPECLQIRVSGPEQRQLVEGWRNKLEELAVEMAILESGQDRKAWLAGQALPPRQLNLLSGEYAGHFQARVSHRRLVPAAVLTLALITVLSVHWLVERGRVKTQHEQLVQSMESLYREAFPDARHIVDARYQMEQRLAELTREGNDAVTDTGFINWLEVLSSAIGGNRQYRIRSIEYQRGVLRLEVRVPDYAALERLHKRLAVTAVVEMDNAERKDGGVSGSLRVRARS